MPPWVVAEGESSVLPNVRRMVCCSLRITKAKGIRRSISTSYPMGALKPKEFRRKCAAGEFSN